MNRLVLALLCCLVATAVDAKIPRSEAAKRAFRAAAQQGLRNAMAFEAMLQKTAIASEDCREGVMALMQKRQPQFKGR